MGLLFTLRNGAAVYTSEHACAKYTVVEEQAMLDQLKCQHDKQTGDPTGIDWTTQAWRTAPLDSRGDFYRVCMHLLEFSTMLADHLAIVHVIVLEWLSGV
jgi:hypothetical protein